MGLVMLIGAVMQKGGKNMIKAEWTNADALNLQPTCNQLATDCISRAAAIDAVTAEGRNVDSRYLEFERIIHEADAVEAIAMLPSAQSEPKRGRWIWNPNGMDWNLGAWCCSECKFKAETWWANDEKYNPLMCSGGHFCGNCGADMRGE